ncbi:MAG TPA: FHA domain-containing protein [Luteolibacter sp.]
MPRVSITVPEKNAQPYRFQLDREVVSLGRGSENDIVIDSGSVSGSHAEMHRIKGGYELRDTGSTNGIKLDGVRYDVIPLLSGTTVHIGDVKFDFLLTEDELGTLDREKPSENLPEIQVSSLPVAEKLPPLKPLPSRTTYTPAPASGGSGFGGLLVLVVLAAAAFFAGLCVRYQKETGGKLIEAIQARHFSAKPAPATPVEPPSK